LPIQVDYKGSTCGTDGVVVVAGVAMGFVVVVEVVAAGGVNGKTEPLSSN